MTENDNKTILSFCVSLDRLAQKSESSVYDVEEFYNSVFEFGAQCLAESQDFSDIERDSIKQSYPSAVEKSAKFAAEIIQHKKLNQLKMLLSSIEFLIKDIYEIFKYFSLNDCPKSLTQNISLLQEKQENIKKMLKSIKNEEGDDDDEIPNLNGIPESHDWWSDKDRKSTTKEESK
uniref:Uncharacterized protein n=1 Tax=Panagrolaimus superbus TaxID=310955 RepID=A0A914YEQ0_9BILA